MGLFLRPCEEDSDAIKLVTEVHKRIGGLKLPREISYVWGVVNSDMFHEAAEDTEENRIYQLLNEGKEVKVRIVLDES